jgi:hypothetical protein
MPWGALVGQGIDACVLQGAPIPMVTGKSYRLGRVSSANATFATIQRAMCTIAPQAAN